MNDKSVKKEKKRKRSFISGWLRFIRILKVIGIVLVFVLLFGVVSTVYKACINNDSSDVDHTTVEGQGGLIKLPNWWPEWAYIKNWGIFYKDTVTDIPVVESSTVSIYDNGTLLYTVVVANGSTIEADYLEAPAHVTNKSFYVCTSTFDKWVDGNDNEYTVDTVITNDVYLYSSYKTAPHEYVKSDDYNGEDGHIHSTYICKNCGYIADVIIHEMIEVSVGSDSFGHVIKTYDCVVCDFDGKTLTIHEYVDGVCSLCGEIELTDNGITPDMMQLPADNGNIGDGDTDTDHGDGDTNNGDEGGNNGEEPEAPPVDIPGNGNGGDDQENNNGADKDDGDEDGDQDGDNGDDNDDKDDNDKDDNNGGHTGGGGGYVSQDGHIENDGLDKSGNYTLYIIDTGDSSCITGNQYSTNAATFDYNIIFDFNNVSPVDLEYHVDCSSNVVTFSFKLNHWFLKKFGIMDVKASLFGYGRLSDFNVTYGNLEFIDGFDGYSAYREVNGSFTVSGLVDGSESYVIVRTRLGAIVQSGSNVTVKDYTPDGEQIYDMDVNLYVTYLDSTVEDYYELSAGYFVYSYIDKVYCLTTDMYNFWETFNGKYYAPYDYKILEYVVSEDIEETSSLNVVVVCGDDILDMESDDYGFDFDGEYLNIDIFDRNIERVVFVLNGVTYCIDDGGDCPLLYAVHYNSIDDLYENEDIESQSCVVITSVIRDEGSMRICFDMYNIDLEDITIYVYVG